MSSTRLVRMLAEVAETASETLDLQQVIERVATSVREVIPFDNIGVVRIIDGDRAVVHASTIPCKAERAQCSPPTPLDAWSPRVRPRPGTMKRLDDATQELDPTFPVDQAMLEGGVRSALWSSFRSGDTFTGGVWLASYTAHAFTDEHVAALEPVAAILGSAVEHWRIWDAERRRQQRLDMLEAIVVPLADALDVREVFDRVSAAAQQVLPHTVLALSEVDVEKKVVHVVALAVARGAPGIAPDPAGSIHLTPQETDRRFVPEILRDMQAELEATTERNRALLATQMRSLMRVPVRLGSEVHGSLLFLDLEPGRYSNEDIEVATRLADRIALVVSHHRLAEEARVAAAERERAERLAATVATLTQELEQRARIRVLGESPSWKDVMRQVGRVASSGTTVLVTGESGTGKEVVSALIHQGSPRRDKPFVAINCAALPEQLLESELFGHEKGAFTGAVATKIGRLEQAAGGTLFLDEIGEMSPLVQAKLLRVLEEREFQRLGGTRTLRADVRVIAATNRDLTRAILEGGFREDLFYRLNVFEIRVAPLRERREDVMVLAGAFLEDLGRSMGRPAPGFSSDAREWMLSYPWPGNVRELRNAVERAILLCDGGLITRAHLPQPLSWPAPARVGVPAPPGEPAGARAVGPALPVEAFPRGVPNLPAEPADALPTAGFDLAAVDRSYVEKALRQASGNKSKAARLLGLSRSQLYSRLEKYGLG